MNYFPFLNVFLDFSQKIIEKLFKWTKKVESGPKKVFWPASWNTQQPFFVKTFYTKEYVLVLTGYSTMAYMSTNSSSL